MDVYKLDKNGCGVPDIYCWECSGMNGDDVEILDGGEERIPTGRMKPIGNRRNGADYQCEDCNYATNYDKGYIREWRIN